MTDSKHDAQKSQAPDDLDNDWAAALSEQGAGSGNQAQGLDAQGDSDAVADAADMDDWAAALAEQTAAETSRADKNDTADTPAAGQTAKPVPELFQPLASGSVGGQSDIDMIMDIPVQMSVELGRTRLTIKNILQLGQGSVVELDGLAGEPMDIYVNGYLIAQGEVVVVEDKYGIRVTDIITPSDRINRLNNRR